jgi:hypothetical protein
MSKICPLLAFALKRILLVNSLISFLNLKSVKVKWFQATVTIRRERGGVRKAKRRRH